MTSPNKEQLSEQFEAREQQSSCGEARFVHAIEVQGRVFCHDADADDGLRAGSFLSKPACLLPMGIIFEAPGSVPIARGDHRPFAIAEFPIQVSSEEHVPLGVGESYRCAHASFLLR